MVKFAASAPSQMPGAAGRPHEQQGGEGDPRRRPDDGDLLGGKGEGQAEAGGHEVGDPGPGHQAGVP